MNNFIVNKKYKRATVLDIIGVPESPTGNSNRGGVFSNGYFKFNDVYYIFTNIGIAGRTGHDYHNKFISDNELFWCASTRTNIYQNQIKELLNPETEVHIFYREENRDDFTYAGLGQIQSYKDETPVQITWKIVKPNISYEKLNQEKPTQILSEGKEKYIVTKQFERNPQAREACIKYYGYKCVVCGFDFEKVYGKIGKEFIHVHHINPLATIRKEYVIDPIKDLRPVCPNCHAMIHRTSETLSIEELQKIIRNK